MRPVRFGHIGLAVRDLERVVEFYVQALEMQISDRMVFPEDSPFYEGVWLRINTDHHVISAFGLRDTSAGSDGGMGRMAHPGIHHMGFEVASFDDLRNILDYARTHDVPVHGTRSGGPGNQLRVYLLDPEDNIVELYFAMDQVGWDGATRPFPPVEQIDLDNFEIDSWLNWKGSDFKPSAASPGVGATPRR